MGYKVINLKDIYNNLGENAKELFEMLIGKSSDDWDELCTTCTTLIKEAKMSDEDIDKIVERVRKENG